MWHPHPSRFSLLYLASDITAPPPTRIARTSIYALARPGDYFVITFWILIEIISFAGIGIAVTIRASVTAVVG